MAWSLKRKNKCPDKLRHAPIPRNWKNQAVPQYVKFYSMIFLFFRFSNNQKHLPQILNIIIKSSWNETLLTSKKVKFEICKIRWVWFSNRILIIARAKSIKNLYFRTTLFLAGAPFSNLWCYSRFSIVDLTKIWISLKLEEQTEFCKRVWIQLNNWYCLVF